MAMLRWLSVAAWALSLASPVASQAISFSHFNETVVSDAALLYGSQLDPEAAWARALQEAWESAGSAALYVLKASEGAGYELLARAVASVASSVRLDCLAPPDLFFVFAGKEQAAALRAAPGVGAVEALPAALKVSPALRKRRQAQAQGSQEVPEVLIGLSPGSKASLEEAQALAAAWEHAVQGTVAGSRAHFHGEADDLIVLQDLTDADAAVALSVVSAQPEAFTLEPMPQYSLLNKDARWITQSGEENGLPLWDAGLRGEGEVVGVADSGLDEGSCFFWSGRAVARNAAPDPQQPKVVSYTAFADGVAGERRDHGTHVVGSIAGASNSSNGAVYDGMAPAAKIAFFDIGVAGQPFLSVPRSLRVGLFPPARAAGAAIHSNSWGSPSNAYTMGARDLDAYSFANEEFVVLVAAGNDGARGLASVGSPATAKNCIAVGASVSAPAGSIENVATFSSRGPTSDGRIKPDVVAPGHSVVSAASLEPCAAVRMSGTSMATPVCAGTLALVRQYFREGFYPTGARNAADGFTPTGALLKAVMVHSGQRLSGDTGGDSFPGYVQGFGRIDMDSVLLLGTARPGGRSLWVHSTRLGGGGGPRVALQQGSSYERAFRLVGAGELKATLVWMDPPAAVNARRALVNDLDLIIAAPGGAEHFPNGLQVPDRVNNVEMISIDAQAGVYTVIVRASSVRVGTSQAYALVVTGPFKGEEAVSTPGMPPGGPEAAATAVHRISNGACADYGLLPITEARDCEAAASVLGLGAGPATATGAAPRPEGCYYEGSPPGGTLLLATGAANRGNGASAGRAPLCKARRVAYLKISNGTCVDLGLAPIADATTCEAAAAALGLADTTAAVTRSRARPEGCYYRRTAQGEGLFLATSAANKGNGAAANREAICRAPAAATPTPDSAQVNYAWQTGSGVAAWLLRLGSPFLACAASMTAVL